MSKIAYFKTLGRAKVIVCSAGQQLQFDFVGVQISIVHDDAPTEAINFERKPEEKSVNVEAGQRNPKHFG